MDVITFLLLILLGLMVGTVSAMLGIGGGLIMVPSLILFVGLDAHQAIGTSILVIVFTATSATIAYLRQKRIDWKLGLITALLSVPAASLGAYSTNFFTSKGLGFAFALALILTSVRIFQRSFFRRGSKSNSFKSQFHEESVGRRWSRRIVDSSGRTFEYSINIYAGIALLFLAGLVSGFLGVGGGIVVVPVYATIMGVPIHLAVATSMFVMIFNSLSGSIVHIALGNAIFEDAIPLVIGIVTGAQIGANLAKKLKSRNLQIIFGIAILMVAVWMIISRS